MTTMTRPAEMAAPPEQPRSKREIYTAMSGLMIAILLAMLDLSGEVELHRLPELICGLKRRPNEGPTLYPVACSPQAWAAATPFFILEACLGMTVQAERGRILFDRPFLPEGIPQLSIRNLQCGKAAVDLLLERRGESVLVHCESRQDDVEVVTTVS